MSGVQNPNTNSTQQQQQQQQQSYSEKKIIEILFQTIIKFKAKLLSSQDKVSRSQQN